MSQPYRLLGEGMPDPQGTASGAPFPADAKKTRQWVAALPRANGQATQQMLAQALDSLAGQKMDGATRLAVLEELRPTISESIGLSKREYKGSSLPLPPLQAAAAQQVEAFHLAMAHGYRRAAVEYCAPSGNIPMLRGGNVATALARATWHYSQALASAWRIYRAPAPGVWQGLHRVRNFAHEHKLDTRAVEDALAGHPVEVNEVYLQALLVAVTHPLAFSQAEQDILWRISGDFATRSSVDCTAPNANAPVVPQDGDWGPGPGLADETHSQWLDMQLFCREVDDAIERQRDGTSDLMPSRGPGIRVAVEMLERLKRSFGLAAARIHRRMDADHWMRTVVGLSGLHFHLAGQRDFDAFVRQASLHIVHVADRATWARNSTDATRVPVHDARVLDQSLGGYRMAWDQADQVRARVGELVGLTLEESDEFSDWMLGVIRWLRYEDGGGLSAGVELISRRTSAVGLRVHGANGIARDPVRALEMEVLEERDEIQFLAPNTLDPGATRIEVIRDAGAHAGAPGIEEMLAGVEILLNAGDYALLRPLRPDLVSELGPEADVEALP